MFKTFISILLSMALFNGCDHGDADKQPYKVVVSRITKGGLSEWYEIHEQYLSGPCSEKEHVASAYLCIDPKTKDTIFVISPCNRNKFKKHTGAALYVYKDVVMGDTLTVYIPRRYERLLHKEEGVSFGTLQIPVD